MIIVGLTGSIGMGKTTAANMLRDMGYPVHCSDTAVADLYKTREVIDAVRALFPAAYDAKTGTIVRAKLKQAVGFDHAKIAALEKILHPLVVRSQQDFLRAQKNAGVKIAVLDIPLLFETGADKRVDYVLCVSAPAFVQEQRVMARPGMTAEIFAFMLARQIPDAEKRRRSDFIINTGAGLPQTRAELADAVAKIKAREFSPGGPKPKP
jgi:dephospho-CoA kinase